MFKENNSSPEPSHSPQERKLRPRNVAADEWDTTARDLDTFGNFGTDDNDRRIWMLCVKVATRHAPAIVRTPHYNPGITLQMMRVALATILAHKKSKREAIIRTCAAWLEDKTSSSPSHRFREMEIAVHENTLSRLVTLFDK